MLRLQARAKINWTLDILGRRADGYHLMDMLMNSVELCDTLELESAPELSLSVTGPEDTDGRAAQHVVTFVPSDEKNLVLKAARALQAYCGSSSMGARMRLSKRVPVGAGMGGGSADAAAALVGLNRLWELGLNSTELLSLGQQLGADIPFVLTGGTARVGGIGEAIQPLCAPVMPWLVVTQPCVGLSTPEIFRAYDAREQDAAIARPDTQAAQRALEQGDMAGLAQTMGNVMEAVSAARQPGIAQAARLLEREGAMRGMMTGSGSAVLGLFPDERNARAAFECVRERWNKTWLTRACEQGVTMEEV